ncbi:hypothetical protein EUGRSUZ_H03379 [Eucalyptus grandis]|uniref:Uncharacterized protein n=2 Tax=Eucalyptus grandis TaxID=71139 RepID=A0ACC3JXX8_EUCGR|nr:hypothetical protein EUGRSUZ_H03379 [Eucalyptus grandis]
MAGTPEKPSSPKAAAPEPPQPSSPFAPAEPAPSSASQSQPPSEEEAKKWGTHVMGKPAVPTVHPDNQKAASWNAADHQQISHQPYIQYEPIDRPSSSPLESVIHMFNTWSKRAETIARNIWHNLKTGQSVSGAAWGKVNLTAKAISEGGFESLFKQIFTTDPNEKLKKTFACYLSTSTGPVAGTLYLSTRPSPDLHCTVRSGGLELLQGYDSFGEHRDSQSCRHEGEPPREVHPDRHDGWSRLLVHGIC